MTSTRTSRGSSTSSAVRGTPSVHALARVIGDGFISTLADTYVAVAAITIATAIAVAVVLGQASPST